MAGETDPFALFDLAPGPALDVPALKEDFARRTADTHPDRFQQAPEAERTAVEARYTALNRAYQTLVDPRARLLALYEMTAGTKPSDVQRIPPGTMDLFVEVGQLCRDLDAHLEKRRAASGRLQRAGLMDEELRLQEALLELRMKLETLGATLETELGALDLKWRAEQKDARALEVLYRKYSYLGRWRQQMEEREIALISEE